MEEYDTETMAEIHLRNKVIEKLLGEEKSMEIIGKIVAEKAPEIAKVCGSEVTPEDLWNPDSCFSRELSKSVREIL